VLMLIAGLIDGGVGRKYVNGRGDDGEGYECRYENFSI